MTAHELAMYLSFLFLMAGLTGTALMVLGFAIQALQSTPAPESVAARILPPREFSPRRWDPLPTDTDAYALYSVGSVRNGRHRKLPIGE